MINLTYFLVYNKIDYLYNKYCEIFYVYSYGGSGLKMLCKYLSNFGKTDNCNCVQHKQFLRNTFESLNRKLYEKYKNNIYRDKMFVAGTMFYCERKLFDEIINFRSYLSKSSTLLGLYNVIKIYSFSFTFITL